MSDAAAVALAGSLAVSQGLGLGPLFDAGLRENPTSCGLQHEIRVYDVTLLGELGFWLLLRNGE